MKNEELQNTTTTIREAAKEAYTSRIPAYQSGTPPQPSTIHKNDSYEGEPIETRVAKIINNNEPITDGAPQIYTERKDGVIPEYNIRTDRFDEAITMTTEITNRELNKRLERQTPPSPTNTNDKPTPNNKNEPIPTPTTTPNNK